MNKVDIVFNYLFSEIIQKKFEKIILFLATAGFIIHLLLIYLNKYDVINFTFNDSLLLNPISALYTPFSFILVYEAFLLIYFIPNSFTVSVVKGYEIISLILIRKIFKDVPLVNLDTNFLLDPYSMQLIYDLLGIIIIFFLIYLFKKNSGIKKKKTIGKRLEKFIRKKKAISVLLVPTLIFLVCYSFYFWFNGVVLSNSFTQDLNYLFFIDFFTILILVDVFILLISFRYTERYSQLIRNTGFIISTILLRLSFGVSGLKSIVLLVSGILFGLLILLIYKKMEKVKYLDN